MPRRGTYHRPNPKQMGLQPYIDSYWQRLHPGAESYAKFVEMIKNETPKKKMRDKLKVGSPNTINTWIGIYTEEQGNG